MRISRNAACPCGSGRKYKRCCLAADQAEKRAVDFDDEVGRRIQDWSARELGDEISAALEDFAGTDRTMADADIQIFATWFHNDRELPGGGTPAERYAARPELPANERAAASRIASARLGLHRVVAVEPGSLLLLEDIASSRRERVRSHTVSREAVRWDILIGRVMDGDPASLWGPVRLLEPADEPDLLAELERLACATDGSRAGEAATAQALRSHALALMRFRPPSWDVEPSFFTLEGDPVAEASATWTVRDVRSARAKLRTLGGLNPGDSLEVDVTVPRQALVSERSELPRGAIVFEASAVDDPDNVPVATVRLEGRRLRIEAMSAERLDRAIEIVELDFEGLVEFADRSVIDVERRLAENGSKRWSADPSTSDLPPADERRIAGDFMTESLRRCLDEPHLQLDGMTPREAAVGERRSDVVRLMRGIENGAERAQRGGQPFADVSWMRGELDLGDELAA